MVISQIAAVAKNGIIGREGTLPWHVPEDLQRFKALTMHKTVIMGRITYEGLPKQLDGRRIIVLSRQHTAIEGAEVARDFNHALELAKGEPEVIIAGGESLYRSTIGQTQRIYLTHLSLIAEGDSEYPLEVLSDFRIVHKEVFGHPEIEAFTVYQRPNLNGKV